MMNEKPLTEEEQFAQFVDSLETEKVNPEKEKKEVVETSPPVQEQSQENIEPFPGFNSLSDVGKQAALAKIQEADEASRKAQDLDQRYRQQHGQLAPIQRKAAELERQNHTLLKRLNDLEKNRHSEAQRVSTEAFDKFKEMYPEEAQALEARVSPLELTNRQLQDEVKRTQQQMAEVYSEIQFQKQTAAVLKEHHDAYEILRDPTFELWAKALEPEEQALITSNNSKDAIKVLNNYKKDQLFAELLMERQKSPASQEPSKKAPKLDVDPNPRNRQSPSPRQGNASGSEEEDFAAFAEAYEKDPGLFRNVGRR